MHWYVVWTVVATKQELKSFHVLFSIVFSELMRLDNRLYHVILWDWIGFKNKST